jgi:RNA polymerase sigma-70 factor (sigma-E family)
MDKPSEARFAEWAATRSPALHRFAFLLCGDWYIAEDLVQEALARAALKWPRIERVDNPDAYVRRIIVNQLTTIRRRKALRVTEGVVADLPVSDTTADHARNDELLTALRLLPTRQRAVITLRYYEDLSEQETAIVLGCSVGTVKSQAHKALQSLRRLLPKEELTC